MLKPDDDFPRPASNPLPRCMRRAIRAAFVVVGVVVADVVFALLLPETMPSPPLRLALAMGAVSLIGFLRLADGHDSDH